jgi:hypothetical protein
MFDTEEENIVKIQAEYRKLGSSLQSLTKFSLNIIGGKSGV